MTIMIKYDFICDDNPYIQKIANINPGTSCGGFRIKWNVLDNTFNYICASKIGPCGCSGGDTCIYYSHDQNITIDDKYLNMANNVIKYLQSNI